MTFGLGTVALVSVVGATGLVVATTVPQSSAMRGVDGRLLVRAVLSVIAVATVVLISGWLPTALVTGVGVWWVSRRSADTAPPTRNGADGDALATWIESVRDLLLAGEQPVGAIVGSVRACPEVLRPAVRRFAAGLGRHDIDHVAREFADDLDDPIGDLVAVGLSVALRRGARTSAVLSSLAEQVRFQSERRRLIEAERAPARREVVMLAAIMSSLLALLLLAGRSRHLDAYDTAAGQLLLVVCIGLFVALIRRVMSLSVFPRPARFFGVAR